MKKYFIAGCLLFTLFANAQKTTSAKPISHKVVQTSPLKNAADSLSYAIGISVANFYREQGMKNINSSMVAKAINDVLGNKKTLLNEEEANLAMMCQSNTMLCENVKEGKKFLGANKKNAKVKTTASGLQYEVLRQGSGGKPAANDSVTVNYMGTLLNGTEVDNSYKRGQPITFLLTGVIKGWTEGLQLMTAGSKYKFYIPYQLGYGLNDHGAIPGGSALIFEIELLSISKGQ